MSRNNFSAVRTLCCGLFALSGAASLMYEVVWVRQLSYILGASTPAVTTILVAFMVGLGIGSWLLGKKSDRLDERRLARLYVLLELGIAAYALVLPRFLDWQAQLSLRLFHSPMHMAAGANLLRLLIALTLFIIPTTLMGGTLPVLSRYLVRRKATIGVTVSRLYALNTLGGVAGTLLAGYVLLGLLGNRLTSLTAVGMNLLAAAGFWIVHRIATLRQPLGSTAADSPAGKSVVSTRPAERLAVVVCFTVSGVAAMFYEVAWTRTLTMTLGTTTYAFTLMLATFLLGMAVGSLLYPGLRKLATPARLLIALQLTVAVSVILTIPFFEKLPFFYLSLYRRTQPGWIGIQLIRFVLGALVMLLPTSALGCVLPAVGEALVGKTTELGRNMGRALGLNTFGAAVGSALAGLLLIPVLGLQGTILVGAILNVAAAALVFLCIPNGRPLLRCAATLAVALVMVLTSILLKPWSPRIMSSGVYVYADRYLDVLERVNDPDSESVLGELSPWQLWKAIMAQYEVLYYRSGPAATVSVMQRQDGLRFLTIDGKTDASTGLSHDMKMQTLLGQLPLLYHERPKEIFVVGLGSGVTVGSVLTHPVTRVDCAELSPSVVEAAGLFADVNNGALQDPRLRLAVADARHVLLTSQSVYDVIISQPSNPWVSGQSSLFSEEWYRIVRAALADGGLFAQWIPAYQMSHQDVKILLNTVYSVFPHTTVWTSGAPGELIALARKGNRLSFSYNSFKKRVESAAIARNIQRLGYDPQLLPFKTFLMSEKDLRAYLQPYPGVPLAKNTDDLLITEYSTPKYVVGARAVRRFAEEEHMRGNLNKLLTIFDEGDALKLPELLEGAAGPDAQR